MAMRPLIEKVIALSKKTKNIQYEREI